MARKAAAPSAVGYDVVTLRVARDLSDLAAAELWARGTLGLETVESGSQSLVKAYFERGRAKREGWGTGSRLSLAGDAEVVAVEALDDQDWLASYRRRTRPFALGRRFWVDPRDGGGTPRGASAGTAPGGRIALALPARRAFGTGTHESTRLAVEILEEENLSGCTVLDVGAGTGVLSLVARALGAAKVVAVEVDPVAALLAAQNRTSNAPEFALFAGRAGCLEPGARFDRVLLNVIPEVIAEELPSIVDRIEPGGRIVVSGFLTERSEGYLRDLERLGLERLEVRSLGEWGAFLLRRQRRGGGA